MKAGPGAERNGRTERDGRHFGVEVVAVLGFMEIDLQPLAGFFHILISLFMSKTIIIVQYQHPKLQDLHGIIKYKCAVCPAAYGNQAIILPAFAGSEETLELLFPLDLRFFICAAIIADTIIVEAYAGIIFRKNASITAFLHHILPFLIQLISQ